MRQTLFCHRCGAPRTWSSNEPYLSGDGSPLVCFRCAHTTFVVEKPPLAQSGWLVTAADRRLLRSLRIGTGSVVEVQR